MINFIVGYFLVINIIGISLIWLRIKTDFIKISEIALNIIFILLSMAGGFIGVLVGVDMFEFQDNHKIFKRWIPLLVFVEICVIIFIVYKNS